MTQVQATDPKTELYRHGTEIFGKASGAIITKLLKSFGADDVFMARRVLQLAASHPDPKAYIFKVIANHKDLCKREALDREQVNNWRPKRGGYPLIDFTHPRQPYYILSVIDGKRLYMDQQRVEELVNNQRDDLGMS